MSAAEEVKNCLWCGDRHAGKCSPSSFNHYQCGRCGREHQMPWDAMAFCGMSGLFCGCGYPAEITWQFIPYEDYLKINPYTTREDFMSISEEQVETEIEEKGLTAPRVTPDVINKLMNGVRYSTHIVEGTTTTVATAIMENGFTLATGVSACASPENFDADLGAQIATSNAEKLARDELWKLEGYRLKRNLEKAA